MTICSPNKITFPGAEVKKRILLFFLEFYSNLLSSHREKSFFKIYESTTYTSWNMNSSAQGDSNLQGISQNISINQTNTNLSQQVQNNKSKYIIYCI